MTDKLSVKSLFCHFRNFRTCRIPSREIVYCKLKWIICRADFHFDRFLSSSLLLTAKEWYRCLGKGFQPEVMVIPAIPFQMWLKFRRNQQGLIGVMTLEVPVAIHPSSTAPSSFSYLRRLSLSAIGGMEVVVDDLPLATNRFETVAVYIYLWILPLRGSIAIIIS